MTSSFRVESRSKIVGSTMEKVIEQFVSLAKILADSHYDMEDLYGQLKNRMAKTSDRVTEKKSEEENSDTTVFQKPKKPAKRPRLDGEEIEDSDIKVSNRYDLLSDGMEIEDDETQEDNDQVVAPPTKPDKTNENKQKTSRPMKSERIAHLIIRDPLRWGHINEMIQRKNIQVKKSKVVGHGVQLEPKTEDDYRNLYKALQESNKQFHAYELKSEKKLKVVLRGVLTQITEEDIKKDLTKQGYPVTKVTRMKGQKGFPIPLVLVEIDKAYKAIFTKLEFCCGLSVQVESLRIKTEIIQCHRCQMFGHAQRNCHAEFKCMKCGDGHMSSECLKSRTTSPKCANCGGDHLSSYIKCMKNPNNPEVSKKKKFKEAPLPKENVWAKRILENKTAKKDENKDKPLQKENIPRRKKMKDEDNKNVNAEQTRQTNQEEELAVILGRMTLTLSSTNATTKQKIAFINEQEKLIKLFKQK